MPEGKDATLVKAAVGFAVHTGWAAAVVVAGPPARVLLRRRIALAGEDHHARFVFHVAAERPAWAKRIIEQAEATAWDRAAIALRALTRELPEHALLIALPAPKKILPDLASVLKAHPLIHSAEGELFRRAIATAAAQLGLRVAIVARGQAPAVGKLGPPWGKDQKDAAALAWAALQGP